MTNFNFLCEWHCIICILDITNRVAWHSKSLSSETSDFSRNHTTRFTAVDINGLTIVNFTMLLTLPFNYQNSLVAGALTMTAALTWSNNGSEEPRHDCNGFGVNRAGVEAQRHTQSSKKCVAALLEQRRWVLRGWYCGCGWKNGNDGTQATR